MDFIRAPLQSKEIYSTKLSMNPLCFFWFALHAALEATRSQRDAGCKARLVVLQGPFTSNRRSQTEDLDKSAKLL